MSTLQGPSLVEGQWESALSGAGSSTSVVAGYWRYTTGTAAAGPGKVARRSTVAASITDCLIISRYRYVSGLAQFADVCLAGDATLDGTGYFLRHRPTNGTVEAVRSINFAVQSMGPAISLPMSTGQIVQSKFSRVAGVVKAKVWSGTEPTTGGPDGDGYQVKFTDAAPLGAGRVGFAINGDTAAGAVCEWDASFLYVTTGDDPTLAAPPAPAPVTESTGSGVWQAVSGVYQPLTLSTAPVVAAEGAFGFAIPRGGLPMPAGTTWRQRVDTAPDSELYVDTVNSVYSHAAPVGPATTSFDEQYAGADGAAWAAARWAAPGGTASTTYTIVGNRGRMVTSGAAGSFPSASRRSLLADTLDGTVTFQGPLPATGTVRIIARERANGAPTDDRLGLGFAINRSYTGTIPQVQLVDFTFGASWPNTVAADRAVAFPTLGASGEVIVELTMAGATAQMRVWTPETARPATAQVSATGLASITGGLALVAYHNDGGTYEINSLTVGTQAVNGTTLRDRFLQMRTDNYGEVALNFEKYNIGFHDLRGRGFPIKDVVFNRDGYGFTPADLYDEALGAHMKGMPFFNGCRPAVGTDRALAVLSDTPGVPGGTQLHEIWQAYRQPEERFKIDNNDTPTAFPLPPNLPGGGHPNAMISGDGAYWTGMEAGREKNTATANVSGAFPNSKGSAATGLPNSYGCVSMWEARQIIEGYTHPTDPGQNVTATGAGGPVRADTGLRANGEPVINHALNMALSDCKTGVFSWPASREDGTDTNVNAIMQGLRIRIDPAVTSAQLAAATSADGKGITPLGKAIAEAIKRYGIFVTDKTYSSIVMTTESGAFHRSQTGTDPWGAFQGTGAAGGWSAGVGGFEILRGIPWDKLQFLRKDYGKPA